MKYTDEEIKSKFSNVNFDKTGWKKQAVFNKIVAKQAGRRFNMRKRYLALTAVSMAVIALIAVPALIKHLEKGSKTSFYDLGASFPALQEEKQEVNAFELPDPTEEEFYVPDSSEPMEEYPRHTFCGEESCAPDNCAPDNYAPMPAPMPANNTMSAGIYRPAAAKAKFRAALSATPAAMRAQNTAATYSVIQTAPFPPIETGLPLPTTAQEQTFAKETKSYEENAFKKASLEPLSTFSADVDTASYGMLKAQINNGWPLQKEGVRIEALINNFSYNYAAPKGEEPLSVDIEYSDSPWNKNNRLVKIGVKAKELEKANLPQSNLVFLIDVSGSMAHNNALPMVKQAFKMLLEQLSPEDIVSIVTYASGVDVKLDGVSVKNKSEIIKAIDGLYASGSTYGEEGLKKAYEVAKKNFIRKGNNRIIIASDGDFNVGESSRKGIEKQVSDAKESGVFISALGFGMGNYRDDLMETIADKGNGNYAYINDMKSAAKALVREFGGTMFTVAKDVKFQVEFNPANVEEYRLIGYEKRALNNADFNDDTKDAGEVGVGHVVTVLYELRPKGSKEASSVDELKYSKTNYSSTDELLTVKVRYKDPDGDTSKLISKSLEVKAYKPFEQASEDFRFASAAAAFGQLVKGSEFKGDISAEEIANIASAAKGADNSGDRAEFVQLIRTYAATPEPSKNDTISRAPRNIIF